MTEVERMIELIMNTPKIPVIINGRAQGRTYQTARNMAEHLIANGVIVLPCKVGDTVYETQPIRQRVQAYEITTVKWNGHYFWFTWVLKDGDGIYGNVDGFGSHKIGKTVFLTREEAEEALAERSTDGKS